MIHSHNMNNKNNFIEVTTSSRRPTPQRQLETRSQISNKAISSNSSASAYNVSGGPSTAPINPKKQFEQLMAAGSYYQSEMVMSGG